MKKKLTLRKETVRPLTEELQDVAGGASGSNTCSQIEASCFRCVEK